VYNSLWPKIKLTANYIYSGGPWGPWTQEERWEENSGSSPSTIAAEIAGLVDAAQITLSNNDTVDGTNWLNAADYWLWRNEYRRSLRRFVRPRQAMADL
jgi:glucoamylase